MEEEISTKILPMLQTLFLVMVILIHGELVEYQKEL
jgi:hypothetical protein